MTDYEKQLLKKLEDRDYKIFQLKEEIEELKYELEQCYNLLEE